jgi:hypothetical protein
VQTGLKGTQVSVHDCHASAAVLAWVRHTLSVSCITRCSATLGHAADAAAAASAVLGKAARCEPGTARKA